MTDEDNSKFSLRPGVTDLLVLLVLFVPAFLKYGGFANDPGVGWHMRTGEWILANGTVPTTDPFLAAETARAWVSDQWLSDVLFWSLYDAGGWATLYAFLTGVYLLVYFGVVARTSTRLSGSALAGAFATLCALKLGTIHFILRPVMLGFLFFALTFAVCANVAARQSDDPAYSQTTMLKRLFLLPPIFVLWANFHPSFILGFIVLGTLLLAFVLAPFFFEDQREHRDRYQRASKNVLGVGVLCFVATLLNPYGISLHESIFALMGSDSFARMNEEWHSPDFLEPSGQLALICFVIIIGVRYLARGRAPRVRLFEFGALLAFTIGYLRSVRLLPFMAIVLAVPLAAAVRDIGKLYVFDWMDGLKRPREILARLEQWELRSSRGLIGLAIALVVLAAGWMPAERFGPSEDVYPHAAIERLKEQDRDVVLFASPNYGGFITWAGGERVRAWIDDRNTMLGEEIYGQFWSTVMLQNEGWVEMLRHEGVTHVLVETKSAFNYAAQRELGEPAFSDEQFTVYRLSD